MGPNQRLQVLGILSSDFCDDLLYTGFKDTKLSSH